MKGLIDFGQLEYAKRSAVLGNLQRIEIDLNALLFTQTKLYKDEGQMADDDFIQKITAFKTVIDYYIEQTKTEQGEI